MANIIEKYAKLYWSLIGSQFLISLFFFTIIEIFRSNFVVVGFITLIYSIGIYASIVVSKFKDKKLIWVVGTMVVTTINLFAVGFIFGQLIALLFGVWEFPPQD